MDNEMIDIEVCINEKIDASVHVLDVLHALNNLEIARKWNAVATILKHLDVEDDGELTLEQRALVKEYLITQLKRFNQPEHESQSHPPHDLPEHRFSGITNCFFIPLP